MMRVFVTGVAGFLGSHIADAFLKAGHKVSGVDNFIGGEPSNIPAMCDFLPMDCSENYEALRRAMRGSEVVYHCAATAQESLSIFSPYENWKHGALASAAVFSAAIAVGVRRIVFMSSIARYGVGTEPPPFTERMAPAPKDPYGVGKVAAENLLRNLADVHGIEWSICIPHNIYGPRQYMCDPFRNVVTIFANMMLQGQQPYIYGDGLQQRAFSFVTDDVEPMVKMATGPEAASQMFNIGPDEEVVTVLDIASRIARLLDFSLDPVFLPARANEVKFAHCSADKARAVLGYKTRVSLDEGLADTVEWVRRNGPRPFTYRMNIEIESPKLPVTWKERRM